MNLRPRTVFYDLTDFEMVLYFVWNFKIETTVKIAFVSSSRVVSLFLMYLKKGNLVPED